MKKLSLLLLAALTSTQARAAGTADPLKSLQWGLSNTGQVVNEALTDINYEKITGIPGTDVSRKKVSTIYQTRMTKDVIVAVIDSGVDIDHPDLKGRLFVNSADCDSLGKPPFHPDEDKDNNSYAGDCIGWNVSGNGDENRVNDDVGHGTHVAGIIAAAENNGVGIAGVAPRVKILPIKLTYSGDMGAGYTGRMLQAFQYALDMKADVINLSLGWPAAADTDALQKKIQEALNRGVIIVVAAGNNTTDKPIYPCSYEGVICVGSIMPNGALSEFSNYGAHVDLLAPGSDILSLIPSQISPAQFSLSGYDFKSGTSQATPFVSGAFAVLKSIYPNASADELKARLLLSSRVRPAATSSVGGLIQIDQAADIAAQSAVFPVIKGDAMMTVNADGSVDVGFVLKNYWQTSAAVSISLAASSNLALQQQNQSLGVLSAGQRKEIHVQGRVSDLSQSHLVQFTLKVTEGTTTRSYVFSKTLVKTIVPSESGLPHLDLDLSQIAGGQALSQLHLQTVKNNFQVKDEPEYYFTNTQGNVQSLVLLRKSGTQLVPTTLALTNGETILNFVKMDLNGDGRADYLLQTYDSANTTQRVFKLWYLNANLKALYDVAAFPYDVDTAMPNWRSLSWVAMNYRSQRMLVPFFIYKGSVVASEQNKDPFADSNDKNVTNRLYFYRPNTATHKMEIHSFDTFAQSNHLMSLAGIDFPESFNFKLAYPQSLSQLAQGDARILMEVNGGSGGSRYYQMRVGDNAQLKSLQRLSGQFSLQGFDIVRQAGFDASSDNLFLSRTQSANIIEFARLRGLSAPQFFSYTHAQAGDNIIGPLTASVETSGIRLLVETKVHVVSIFQDSSGRQSIVSNPINRSSVLDGNVFTELFAPVKIAGQSALYIDASQLYRGHAYSLSAKGAAFQSSVNDSLQIAESCSALNPSVQGSDSLFVIYCEDSSSHKKSIYQMPMQ